MKNQQESEKELVGRHKRHVIKNKGGEQKRVELIKKMKERKRRELKNNL